MEVTYTNNGKQAYFNGKKYIRDDVTGYYRHFLGTTSILLHRAVYEAHNGACPQGYHVHHIDGNKANNEIDNLQMLSAGEHEKLHAEHFTEERKEQLRQNLKNNAAPKAAQWHKSKAGSEWHKQHFEESKGEFLKKAEFTCIVCGKTFITQVNGRNKFCSNNCKSKYRRLHGIDNIDRVCTICGKTFTVNKYSITTTCGKECSIESRIRTRRMRQQQ